jgi:hypothetical protein
MAQHPTHTHDHRHPGRPNPGDIRKALGGANYPATREKLVETARDNGANQGVVDLVNNLPRTLTTARLRWRSRYR